eukprot:2447138-Amphidinium_carterae.1
MLQRPLRSSSGCGVEYHPFGPRLDVLEGNPVGGAFPHQHIVEICYERVSTFCRLFIAQSTRSVLSSLEHPATTEVHAMG